MQKLVIKVVAAVIVLAACARLSTGAPIRKPSGSEILIVVPSANGPIAFGAGDLKTALRKVGYAPKTVVGKTPSGGKLIICASPVGGEAEKILRGKAEVPAKAESFVIARQDNRIAVVGRDAVGTMYGLFELAERIGLDGANALAVKKSISQSPLVDFRATNPFLSLPYGDEKNWWFLSEDFWKTYLDLVARSRFNWVDLHGMYDVKTTKFPNIYPYFIGSKTFPLAGAPKEVRERNLAMLNKVIGMAKDRGVKFALMSYGAPWSVPGYTNVPYKETEENSALYTKEVVSEMIRRCPDLEMIGFRVGESGRSEGFYQKSYLPAIAEAGRKIDLYTRAWGTRKDAIMRIGEAFPGRLFLEIKYNGEQYGPPYHVAGGRMAGWNEYSYKDYMTYPRAYKVIWQNRANGTHRVFPWGSPERVARTARTYPLAGSVGFCLEPMTAYYPLYDFRHRDDCTHKYWNWSHERDWFWHTLWGRLTYDPNVPERVWVKMFENRFGKAAGKSVYKMMVKLSEIVPDSYTFYSLGPDHRSQTVELETGGTIRTYARGMPFDPQTVQSPREYVESVMQDKPTGRLTPYQAADILDEAASDTFDAVLAAKATAAADNKEFQCLTIDALALTDLAQYYAERLRGATEYNLAQAANDPAHLALARQHVAASHQHWNRLAKIESTHYKPFVDTLRIHTEHFTWLEEAKKLSGDQNDLDDLAARIEGQPKKDIPVPSGTDTAGPDVRVLSNKLTTQSDFRKRLRVDIAASDPAGVRDVYLKQKSFPSEVDWRLTKMKSNGSKYSAEMAILPQGAMWCVVAIDKDGNGTQYPDFRKETPYLVIDPWEARILPNPGPETTRTLDALKAAVSNFSAMVIGANAAWLNSLDADSKKRIAEIVQDGLPLLILSQDSPDFDWSWLPGNPKVVAERVDWCDLVTPNPVLPTAGASLAGRRLAYYYFDSGEGWEFLCEPATLAMRKMGKGFVLASQLHAPNLLSDLLGYVSRDAPGKPILLLDHGDGVVLSDLCAQDKEFLLLREVK